MKYLVFLIPFIAPSGFSSSFDDQEKTIQDYINDSGSIIYALAWPTATYERTEYRGITRSSRDRIAKIRLHGRSAFSDGPLWVDVEIVFRDGALHDLRWGSHNALLVPPGETAKAMAEIVKELADEYERNRARKQNSADRNQSSGETFGFHFTNKCSHSIKLLVHYVDQNERWRTVGWWNIKGGTSTTLLNSNNIPIKSGKSIFYYYAESVDGSNLVWKGNTEIKYQGVSYLMKKVKDESGINNWTTTCP